MNNSEIDEIIKTKQLSKISEIAKKKFKKSLSLKEREFVHSYINSNINDFIAEAIEYSIDNKFKELT